MEEARRTTEMRCVEKAGAIAQPLRDACERYAQWVREVFDSNARGLLLFGPAASPEFNGRTQTAASVLVLDRVDLPALRRFSAHGPTLGRLGFKAPLVMTRAQIDATRDTFPLELLEIYQQHQVVFGDDPFATLHVESGHVRLQCERELKTMLIAMRQGLLAAAGRRAEIAAMELDVGVGLMRVLRGLLWLDGEHEFLSATEVLAKIEELLKRPLPGVRASQIATAAQDPRAFDLLYADLEGLSAYANSEVRIAKSE